MNMYLDLLGNKRMTLVAALAVIGTGYLITAPLFLVGTSHNRTSPASTALDAKTTVQADQPKQSGASQHVSMPYFSFGKLMR